LKGPFHRANAEIAPFKKVKTIQAEKKRSLVDVKQSLPNSQKTVSEKKKKGGIKREDMKRQQASRPRRV